MTKEDSAKSIKISLKKKNDLLVCIPTFCSLETTRKTITALTKQKNTEFDILLIDNNSTDYISLLKEFPNLNHVILSENYGSSGAQYIGAIISLEFGYKYIMFSDNDALLLDDYGIKRLIDAMKTSRADGVFPQNVEFGEPKTSEPFTNVNSTTAFHYLIVRVKFIKKYGLHPFDIFLCGDDISMTAKIISNGKLVRCNTVRFFHPLYSPKMFGNEWGYYAIRNLSYLSLWDRNISGLIRMKLFILGLTHIARLLVYYLCTGDVSYIKTISLGIHDGVNQKLGKAHDVPKNKINYSANTDSTFARSPKINQLSTLFLLPAFRYFSNFHQKYIYFSR